MSGYYGFADVQEFMVDFMLDDQREKLLTEEFLEITAFDHARRHMHDQDGFLAYEAGSARCLALGHVEPDGGWLDDTDHPNSWEGEPLCEATKYDTCCTQCEGECDYEIQADLFWTALARYATRGALA